MPPRKRDEQTPGLTEKPVPRSAPEVAKKTTKKAAAKKPVKKAAAPPPQPVEVVRIYSPTLGPTIRRLQEEHRRRFPLAPSLKVNVISSGRVELS
jgi:hypothetical protein